MLLKAFEWFDSNLNEILKQFLLILIISISMLSGWLIGRALPAPQYIVHPDSVFEKSKENIWQRTTDAVRTLSNCLAFRKQYRKEFKDYLRYIAKNRIALGFDSANSEAYAYRMKGTDTIWLTSGFFTQSNAEQERTLAHELLHFVLPSHKIPLNPSEDAIYNLTDACYPELPAEASIKVD